MDVLLEVCLHYTETYTLLNEVLKDIFFLYFMVQLYYVSVVLFTLLHIVQLQNNSNHSSSHSIPTTVSVVQKMEVPPHREIKKEKVKLSGQVKHFGHTSASEDDVPLVSEVGFTHSNTHTHTHVHRHNIFTLTYTHIGTA